MKKYPFKSIFAALFLSAPVALFSQNISMNPSGSNGSPAAILDLSGNPNLGFLMPEVALTNSTLASPILSPPAGLIVYDSSGSTSNGLLGRGFYYWSGTQWLYLLNNGTPPSSIGGSGTTSYLTRWVSPTTLGTGVIQDNGTGVGISSGVITPKSLLDVNGGVAIGSYAGNNAAPSNGLIVSGGLGIGTNSPDASAIVDVTSSTQGILIPRLASNPVSTSTGLMYYNTTTNCFVFWTGTAWQNMSCACSGPPSTPGSINGVTTYCPNASGLTYSISPITGATYYTWSAPSGATITAGQGTTNITVTFGSVSGSISVTSNNNCAASTASILAVTAYTLPAITGQPSSANLCSTGGTANFIVSAIGNGLTYQWQVNSGSGFTDLSNSGIYAGATTPTLTVTNPTTAVSGYQYECIVSGNCIPGSTSNAATLTVTPIPVITGQPGSANLCVSGGTTTFTVAATGSGLTYQWQVNTGSSWSNVSNGGVYSGATTASLTVTNPTSTYNGYQYECIVNNGPCNPGPTSNPATLTVTALPTITGQPSSSPQLCSTGATQTFTVSAAGSGVTYQWEVNSGSGYTVLSDGGIYSGSATPTLTITNPTTSQNGYLYNCIVNNSICNPGSTSNAATLSVGTFILQPVNATASTTGTANFVVGAIGATSYQWMVDSTNGFGAITNNSFYSGATTATLTVTDPTDAMNGYQYECVVNGSCPAATSNAATLTVGSISYIPIAITNSQTTATPNPFVQMVAVNSSTYSSYESSGLQNIEFTTGAGGTGTLLYAWIESGATSASTSTVYWVNLATSIAASSTDTIYMNFLPSTTTMTSTTGYTGLAPQLFGGSYYATSYGQYDNGAKVFSAYFNGNTPSTSFTYTSSVGSGTLTSTTDAGFEGAANFPASTAITVLAFRPAGSYSSSNYAYVYSAKSFPIVSGQGYIAESSYRQVTSNSDQIGSAGFYDGTGASTAPAHSMSIGFKGNYESEVYWANATSGTRGDGQGSSIITALYGSVLWGGTSATTSNTAAASYYCYEAPALDYTSLPPGPSSTAGYNSTTNGYSVNTFSGDAVGTALYLGVDADAGSGEVNINWMRARPNPPNNTGLSYTMPTVILGSEVTITGPSSSPQLCNTGASQTFTVSAAGSSGLNYQWQVNSGSGYTTLSNGGIYSGVTTPSLTITNPATSQNGYLYECVVSGNFPGTATSGAATLSVGTFTLQPTNTLGTNNSNATFTVGAIGATSYQWMVDSTNGFGAITNNSFYSGATTDSLTVANPTNAMNGYQYECVVNGSCPAATSNIATLFVNPAYIPIKITNSQTTATPNPFVQMITLNSSTYSSYESSGLQNIEFTTGPGLTGTPLYAWIESGATSASTSTVYWVNLGASIAASSTYTIYMNFLPASVMSSTTSYTGEAPQLFGGSYYATSYGQYDNGAKVFLAYFNGNTPSTSFTYNSTDVGSGTLTSTTDAGFEGIANFPASTAINVQAFRPSGSYSTSDFAYIYSAQSFPVTSGVGYIAESSYRQVTSNSDQMGAAGFFDGKTGVPNHSMSVGFGNGSNYESEVYWNGPTSGTRGDGQGSYTASGLYGSVLWGGTSATTSNTAAASYYCYEAPALDYTSTPPGPGSTTGYNSTTNGYSVNVFSSETANTPLYLGVDADHGSGQVNINWMRARPNPPNNTGLSYTMPTVSLGSVQ